MTKCNFINQKDSKFLIISGEDSKDFLQSLITNDINKCFNNNIIYSCLLSPQGKFIADFFISNYSGKYLIEVHEKLFDYFLSKIKIYKLRSKIEIEENIDFHSIILFEKNIFKESNKDIFFFKDPRCINLGTKAYIKKSIFNDVVNKLKLNEISFNVYRKELMKNLIPYSPEDLIINKSLLLENNFQNLNAIDWNKGCYVGQEITARMKYRSLLKKQLYVLKISSGTVKLGEILFDNDIKIGEIVSKCDQYLLAMLKINLAEERKNNKNKLSTKSKGKIIFL